MPMPGADLTPVPQPELVRPSNVPGLPTSVLPTSHPSRQQAPRAANLAAVTLVAEGDGKHVSSVAFPALGGVLLIAEGEGTLSTTWVSAPA